MVGGRHAEGGEERRLTSLGSVYDPAWSPYGERIVFSAFARGRSLPESDLFAVSAEDADVRQLARTLEGEEAPSPDGEQIAYERLSSRPTLVAYQIWALDADGENERRVSNAGSVFDLHPVWSPDGRELAFFADVDEPAIWVVDADGNGRARTVVERVEDPAFDWAVRVDD